MFYKKANFPETGKYRILQRRTSVEGMYSNNYKKRLSKASQQPHAKRVAWISPPYGRGKTKARPCFKVVVKKTLYYTNVLFLQPLMPTATFL
jgi:hypothetical protein